MRFRHGREAVNTVAQGCKAPARMERCASRLSAVMQYMAAAANTARGLLRLRRRELTAGRAGAHQKTYMFSIFHCAFPLVLWHQCGVSFCALFAANDAGGCVRELQRVRAARRLAAIPCCADGDLQARVQRCLRLKREQARAGCDGRRSVTKTRPGTQPRG